MYSAESKAQHVTTYTEITDVVGVDYVPAVIGGEGLKRQAGEFTVGGKEQVIEIHVRGGVAYGPEDNGLPPGVRVEITDHDNR